MYILGISCFYHESAAALIKDGTIIAASAEERFSRIKHDHSFPSQAIDFCLKFAAVESNDLDFVVFYEKPFLKFERNLLSSLNYFPKSWSFFVDSMKNLLSEKLWVKSIIVAELKINPQKILFVPHHISHASAAFYPSPFEEATYLIIDGVGEWSTISWGKAIANKIEPMGEIRFPHSVGLLYSTFTAYFGFEVNDGEYKVMGMAGYGKPKYISKIKKLYKQQKDGSVTLNLDYFSFYKSSKSMYSDKFIKEFQRLNKFDIAASLQRCTEEIVFKILEFIYQQTKQDYLVYGGGVALNSVLNAKIIKETSFKNIFIFPAAGDDGGAVGAALFVYHQILGNKKRSQLVDVFLGSKDKLKNKNQYFKTLSNKKLYSYIAWKLSEGKVVGWFESRAEFGPRALGHRSILADPRDPKMKDTVNTKIKFREEFRPFAPAILEEFANEYFENVNQNLAKFMLGTFRAKSKAKKFAPAIVHVDETSRVQIVDKKHTGGLRKILEEFYQKTGVPILLNTSFNLKGEPIVNTIKDAYLTFEKSELDILVVDNHILEK